MSTFEVHKSDWGTTFIATVKEGAAAVDLRSATVKEIIFKKPSGDLMTKAASFPGTGQDGRMQVVTAASEIVEEGTWQWQVHLIFSTSGEYKSDIKTFKVVGNLVDTNP